MANTTLSNGLKVPAIAYGTGTAWYVGNNSDRPDNRALVDSIKCALKIGYRHIDTAEGYGTEREVGSALKEFLQESKLKREDIVVTTKLYQSLPQTEQALKASLQRLQLSYVDLYLIHAPPVFKDSEICLKKVWTELEGFVDAGLVKAIGVSNFRVQDLQELLSFSRIKPAVNQVENHPYLQQPELHSFMAQHGIVGASYSPLASLVHKPGGPLDAAAEAIAKKHSVDPSQVLLRWNLQKGNIVVTTSSKEERLRSFLAVGSDVSLSDEEMKLIDEAGAQLQYRKYWANKL